MADFLARILDGFRMSLQTSEEDGFHHAWGTARLRLLFLAPLAIAILAIILVLAIGLYLHEHENVEHDVIRIHASAREFYEDSVRYDARALSAVMDALSRDEKMRAAFKRRDRNALLAHAAPLFDELKRDYNITHFYFTRPDRVNLLRVHSPPRYGDVINRVTTQQAEMSGTSAFGVELGPLGTLTLRFVSPWYDETTHQLLGYVELGIEVDRVMQKLRDFFGLKVTVLIHKEFLDQVRWEEGMRALGRTVDWNRFPEVVVGAQLLDRVPEFLAAHLGQGEPVGENLALQFLSGGLPYRLTFLPIRDAAGKNVAEISLLANVTDEIQSARTTVYTGSMTALGFGALLFIFFFWLVGRVGHRIENDEMKLEQLATRDGLTGLRNHRAFCSILEDELKRSRRFDHPLSLLMIDIDNFKRVNDTHGHQAGDSILKGLSKRLVRHVRAVDRVCRYGGEEIAVVLPETTAQAAGKIAESLRKLVANRPFNSGNGKRLPITVSIGVASRSAEIDAVSDLVSVADAAMYDAKKSGRNCVRNAAKQKPHRSARGNRDVRHTEAAE